MSLVWLMQAAIPVAHELVTRANGHGKKHKCVHVKPDANGAVPKGACHDYYQFTPNFGAAIFFAVAFALTFGVHLWLAIKWKKAYVWTLLMGLAWEVASFVFRYYGGHHQQDLTYEEIWMILFLTAPLWTNAFIYMTASRLTYKWIPDHKVWGIRSSLLGKLFILLDIVSFFVQIIGAGMLSNPKNLDTGINIFTFGLAAQEIFILVFAGILVTVHVRTNHLRAVGVIPHDSRIRRVLVGMYVGLALITIRIIFHIIEFQSAKNGNTTYFNTEVYQLVLDAAVILVCNIVLAVLHPGLALGVGRDIPKRKIRKAERKEIKQLKKDGRWNGDRFLAAQLDDVESGHKESIPLHSPAPSVGVTAPSHDPIAQDGTVYVPHRQ